MKKIIGTGAAGNKAAIKLITEGVINRGNVLLLNTTSKDIPQGYEEIFVKIGIGLGGAGKERDKGKKYVLEAFEQGKLEIFDSLLDPDDDGVIIITSTEGGSGSGSTSVIAQYFSDVVGTNVHIVAFTGFEDDARGLANTIDFFKDMEQKYTFEVICNSKFMDECDNNKMKAHELANDEFALRLRTLLGQTLVDCEQNIDPTDLYKVVNTPGLLTIETAPIKNLKNPKQFNDILNQMVDNSKSIDINESGVLRLAVILNINEKSASNVDYDFTALKTKLGIPYECFQHVQYTTGDEFVSIIASGMRLPQNEIRDMYEKYQETLNKVNTSKESFFSSISTLDTDSSSAFNVDVAKVNGDIDKRKAAFLASQSGAKVDDERLLVVSKNAFVKKDNY